MMKRRLHGRLAIYLLLVLALAPDPAVRAQGPANVAEQYLVAAANQERAQVGLPPLHVDSALRQAAARHASAMAQRREISHQFAGESELAARGGAAGARFSIITENVGESIDAVLVQNAWMHSAGHRANLLDDRVDSVGIAVVERGHQLYAVEDFSRSVRVLSYAEQEAAVGTLLAKAGIRVASTETVQRDSRLTCGQSMGYAGSRRPLFVMRFTAGSLDRLPDALKLKLSSGRYREASVGACQAESVGSFSAYSLAVLLYPE